MPEVQSMFPYSRTPEPPQKKTPIKMSCGIGDSDGFPAFDVESETYASKDDSKWNFLITGGAEFHMPLTVFQVTPDGLADKAGIRLGDIILEINEEDATQLTLSQAHEKINASGKKIQFLVKSMEDDDNLEGYEPGEERSIVMRVPKPMPPPKDFTPTPLLGSRCWHPIMWTPPAEPPQPKKKKTKTEIDEEGNEVIIELSEDESSEDEEEQELPHHRIIRNIKRFFTENKDKELKNRIIEDMLLALPAGPKEKKKDDDDTKSIEARLRDMQRKLSEIAEIPKILSSTLATVSQTFDKLMPGGGGVGNSSDIINDQQKEKEQQAQHRKFSYDEDAIDYALNDYNEDDNDDDDDMDEEHDGYADAASQRSQSDDNDEKEIERDLQKLTLKLRDLTPESDYASSESDNNDEEDDDDAYEDANDGNDIVGIENAETADDFLTTSFTWRMRKVPKVFLNGQPNQNSESSNDDDNEEEESDGNRSKSTSEDRELIVRLPAPPKNVKVEKRGPLESVWPWADRTKIIYKQSTCHLVPRHCGIIEKSKQQLAKQNLFNAQKFSKYDQQK